MNKRHEKTDELLEICMDFFKKHKFTKEQELIFSEGFLRGALVAGVWSETFVAHLLMEMYKDHFRIKDLLKDKIKKLKDAEQVKSEKY